MADKFLDRMLAAPGNIVRGAADRWLTKRLIDELAGIRKALEWQVDTQRAGMGLAPVFVDPMPEQPKDLTIAHTPGAILRGGDFQLVWLIEELAAEHRIPIEPDTDLEALALSRGWLSPDGKLQVVPESARGMEVAGPWA